MSTFRALALAVVQVAAFAAACGGTSTASSPNEPSNAEVAQQDPSGASSSAAPPGTTPSATPSENASEIVLPAHGLKLALPAGWSQKREGNNVLAFSPSGKSGMLVYATKISATDEVIPLLHLIDDKLGVVVQVGLGEKWISKSGLRFSRAEQALKTKRGEGATSITLLGAAPADRDSAAGVIAVAVEGDGDAKAAIESALATIAPL